MNRFRIATGLVVAITAVTLGAVGAFAKTSHVLLWTTHNNTGNATVVCGITPDVYGSVYSSGAMASVNGYYPGLQCDAEGLRNPHPQQGDPAVALGQGSAGKARIIETSQDNYESSHFTRMPEHATWSKDGITCKIDKATVSCHNTAGHGFTLRKGYFKAHN